MYLYEKGLLIMISQNMVIKIFDKSEMQRLKTAFKTEIKKKKKKSKQNDYLSTTSHSTVQVSIYQIINRAYSQGTKNSQNLKIAPW